MKNIIIENKVGRVRLNDSVNPFSTDELIGDIERLYGQKAVADNLVVGGFEAKADDALEVLELDIHTPGGSVLDGYRIHNSLMQMRSRGVRVVATVNTLAASMGSVIIMAADEINIVPGGRIMIHEAQQTVSGDSAAHERSAKILDEMSDEIAELYAERTGKPKDEMRELMKKETWMGAKEALERGFADFIVSQVPAPVETPAKASSENSKETIMSLSFLTNKQSTEKIEGLTARITDLETDATARDEELTAARAEVTAHAESVAALITAHAEAIATITAERDEVATNLATITAELDTTKADLATAQAEVAALPDKIAAGVENGIASLGFTGKIPDGKQEDENKEVTREEFNGMSARSKSEFCKAGGKIK